VLTPFFCSAADFCLSVDARTLVSSQMSAGILPALVFAGSRTSRPRHFV